MTTIELPTGAVHTRKTITDCEWKIRTFVERDAYVAYDYWITTRDLPTDRVAREHLYAINNAMRARAGIAPWQALFGARLEQLARIPLDLDLITSPDDEVDEGLRQLAQIVRRITGSPGVTDMATSKVLHLLRPQFVTISDTYVRLCLGVLDSRIAEPLNTAAFCAIRMDRVQRRLRELGHANRKALERCRRSQSTNARCYGSCLPVRRRRSGLRALGCIQSSGIHRELRTESWVHVPEAASSNLLDGHRYSSAREYLDRFLHKGVRLEQAVVVELGAICHAGNTAAVPTVSTVSRNE